MGGNASVRRRPSLSTSRQRSMPTKPPMNTAFLLMERIFLTTGREGMANKALNSKHEILMGDQGTRKSGWRIPGIRISGKVKE
jgi:hypothetical protein